jgi:hypothetical protein
MKTKKVRCKCKTCGKENTLDYSEKYDCYYCCGEWQESKCKDPKCEFCSKRPEFPPTKR